MADHDETGRDISYARFQEMVAKRNEAEQRASAAEAKLGAANKRATMLESKLEDATSESATALANLRLEHEMDRAMLGAGIDDPDVVDYLRHKFGSLTPEEGEEAPAFSQWFESYREGKPAILRSFEKEEAPPPREPAKREAAGAPPPRKPADPPARDPAVNGRENGAPPPREITPEDLRTMSKAQIDELGGLNAILAGQLASP